MGDFFGKRALEFVGWEIEQRRRHIVGSDQIQFLDNPNDGTKGQIDPSDHLLIEGSHVSVADFLTKSEYKIFGSSIEARSSYLKAHLNRADMNLHHSNVYRFAASYEDYVKSHAAKKS